MTLTVLTDEQINTLLENLTGDQLDEFCNTLASALHDYSNDAQATQNGMYHQPHRVSTYNKETSGTTLFMPSRGPQGLGVKVVTLSSPPTDAPQSAEPICAIRPTGAITLFSPTGQPTALLHAAALTAFRTALASTLLLRRRTHVHVLTVFGAGNQAYWHIRLALKARGAAIKHVNLISRSFSQTVSGVLKRFYAMSSAIRKAEGWENTTFSALTPSYADYGRLRRQQLHDADVVFCCTPSTEELFPADDLTDGDARRKGRLVVAVGSYAPHMRELPEGLLKHATRSHEKGHRHYHKHAIEGGVIVVDTLDGVLKEAGEIISAGIEPSKLVELGELVMLDRACEICTKAQCHSTPSISSQSTASISSIDSETSSTTDSSSSSSRKRREDNYVQWLRDGTVVYKSVGLGLMDLVVGGAVVKTAGEMGVGTQIEGF